MTQRAFRTADGLRDGLTPGTLRGPAYLRPTSGVRILRTPRLDASPRVLLLDRCLAIAMVLGPAVAFSHTTALRLHEIELPWRLVDEETVHVTSGAGNERTRRTGIVGHATTRPLTLREVAGLRVVEPAQAWVQVASMLSSVEDVVVLGDRLLDRERPTATLERLAAVLVERRGSPGTALCRRALPLVRPGTDSSMETRARLELVGSGLPCPIVNEPVFDERGLFVSQPDMKYERERVAIEYDGDVHRTDRATWRRDQERRERMRDAGWDVLSATADDVIHHPGRLAARVRRALERARSLDSARIVRDMSPTEYRDSK